MALEVEYKFLVADASWREDADDGVRMSQGYLANRDRLSIRVRVAGDKAWLNVKHAESLTVRHEYEYPIPLADAEALLATACTGPQVEKTRYIVKHAQHVWEVDVFHADNEGLVMAEIELESPDERFQHPRWLGQDVSNDPRYLNQNLAKHPYGAWSPEERA